MSMEPRPGGRSITIRLPSGARLRSALKRLRFGRFGQGRLLALLLSVVLVVAVVDALLYREAHDQSAVADARSEAIKSANTRLPAMLSYKYASLDHDLSVASSNATGDFRTQYASLLREVVAPNAKEKRISTSATVTGSSVVSATARTVVVLLFVTQSTTTGASNTPVLSGSRIEVQMTKTDQGWLVSKLTPV